MKTSPLTQSVESWSNTLNQAQDPDWLKTIRKEGAKRFIHQGIPTIKDEEWKYTNLSDLAAIPFQLMPAKPITDLTKLKEYCQGDQILLVFVNGYLNRELSQLNNIPTGLTILDYHDAVKSYQADIDRVLHHYNQKDENPFISLNHAIVSEGIFIKLAAKTIVQEFIHIVHVTDHQSHAITAPRAFILLEPSSEMTILESHLAFSDESEYCSIPLTDIEISENATLHYCKAQAESRKSYHLGTTRVWQERDSNFDGFSLMTGGMLTRNNLDIVVNGEGASSILNGFYGVDQNQHVDNHSSVDHRVPNCVSNQLYKGILNGQSHSVFNGKIFVKPIAQKTNSYQLNKNLILGTDCRVDTKPQLEIFADDVKCTHGATIGQLNEEEIFYLQARAIPRKTAIKLLAKGYVDDMLQRIPNPIMTSKLTKLLEPVFAAL